MDSSLILHKGNFLSFSSLYEQHYDSIYFNVLRIIEIEIDAEDITQESFLQLWKKLREPNAITDVESYLFRISYNLSLTYLQRRKRRLAFEERFSSDLFCTLDEERSDEILKKVTLNKAVANLSAQQRNILILRAEHGMTREQVAKQLNISPFTVKVTMQNAMRSLRLQMKEDELV